MAILAGALAFGAVTESVAYATPQWSGALVNGIALTDFRDRSGPHVTTHLAGRFDVLLLRERAGTMALGPYFDVATTGFETFESGGGLEWLIPAGDTAFILSGGAFARKSSFGWEPGAASTLFWGSRSFNYHSNYSVGVGLFAQGRYGLAGDGKQADAIFGLHVDLEYVALPFMLAYEAIRR